MDKPYYNLHEAIARLGRDFSVSDLIYLGAHEDLPIYILASEWDVDTSIEEPDDQENPPIGRREHPSTFPDRLDGLIRLHARTLLKFEANRECTTNRFCTERTDDDGERHLYWYNQHEYPVPNALPSGSSITVGSLLVMADDLAVLQAQSVKTPKCSLSTTERNTLLKLVIGMAIAGYKYQPDAARNSATGEITKDLESLGIGLEQDTVKKWLKEGTLLLPAKPDAD